MIRRLLISVLALGLMACGSTDTAAHSSSAPPRVTTPPSTTSTSGMPAATEPPVTTVPSSEEPADPGEGGEAPVDAAAAAFEAWTAHIAEGDEQAAWDGLAETSQVAVGREVFSDMMTAMSEGWAAWAWAEDVSYRISTDEAGRTLLHIAGTVTREGMTETTENVIPVVHRAGAVLVSPFEEFGNVAEGVDEEIRGEEPPPVPEASGDGRRVVYSNGEQRVWLVDDAGDVIDSYLVSGKKGVPAPGTYEVYSRSETAFAGHDGITMRHMVRFAHGDDLPIGFHAIPNDASGAPLQSEEQLGGYRSAGCVRQSVKKAAFLYEWATEGTPVVVLA